jgi:GNAT superfamily N-acetyltransferase
MKLQRIEEFQVNPQIHEKIRQLFEECFPHYPKDRTYFKQLPNFRYLYWEGDQLIAHMGVEHRMVNNAGQLLSVFGIVDLCVSLPFQHQKIASLLLKELEKLGKEHQVDFLLLAAADTQLYLSNGFDMVSNHCKWLMIKDHAIFGVIARRLENTLMVKTLNDKEWREGGLDFLGTIF